MENTCKNKNEVVCGKNLCDTDRSTSLSYLLEMKETVAHKMIANNNYEDKTYELLLAIIVMYIKKNFN